MGRVVGKAGLGTAWRDWVEVVTVFAGHSGKVLGEGWGDIVVLLDERRKVTADVALCFWSPAGC